MLWHPAPSPNYYGSFSQECISVMKIEGLPVIDVDESETLQGRDDANLHLATEDEAILADFLARHKSANTADGGD
jgi:hypothetical protein